MTTHADLIARLREHECGCGGECGQRTPEYIAEAAAALEAQGRRVAELEAAQTVALDNEAHDYAALLQACRRDVERLVPTARHEGWIAGMKEATEVAANIYRREVDLEIAEPGEYRAGRKYVACEILAALQTASQSQKEQQQ